MSFFNGNDAIDDIISNKEGLIFSKIKTNHYKVSFLLDKNSLVLIHEMSEHSDIHIILLAHRKIFILSMVSNSMFFKLG